MKPNLADDWVEAKVRFPVLAQPKIDGVRALNQFGNLTGRSLKPFKNQYTTRKFSHTSLLGFDGEMAANRETHPDLCRLTSSALGTITGEPFILWHLFDYVTPDTVKLPYEQRLALGRDAMEQVKQDFPDFTHRLKLIDFVWCNNLNELNACDDNWLAQGYEGTIIRDPNGLHKSGRSTVREGGLLRIKRFVDLEFTVDTIIEAEENQNEAQTNELGQTFRSSHQENKVGKGMIGAMIGRCLNVVKDGDKVLFEAGQEIRVGAGCLSHEDRERYFKDQDAFKRLVHKAKFFPKGIKDKPRFPTWQSSRMAEDMS